MKSAFPRRIWALRPDFVKLAEAYGLKGAHVSTVEELKAAIEEAKELGPRLCGRLRRSTPTKWFVPWLAAVSPSPNFMLI